MTSRKGGSASRSPTPRAGWRGRCAGSCAPRLGPVGPQQPGQRLAPVGAVGLHGQVGQQGAHLVGMESGDGFSVQGHLEGSQQGQRQMWHSPPRAQADESDAAAQEGATMGGRVWPPMYGGCDEGCRVSLCASMIPQFLEGVQSEGKALPVRGWGR